jgi:hypothetical protein
MSVLTVYFDDPWWVGVIEIEKDGVLCAARHVFGGEPSNEEVLDFVLQDFIPLIARPTVGVAVESAPERKFNPKRAARQAARLMRACGVSTKAQAALKLQQEAGKQERQGLSRAEKERLAEYKRQKARAKARARHQGH